MITEKDLMDINIKLGPRKKIMRIISGGERIIDTFTTPDIEQNSNYDQGNSSLKNMDPSIVEKKFYLAVTAKQQESNMNLPSTSVSNSSNNMVSEINTVQISPTNSTNQNNAITVEEFVQISPIASTSTAAIQTLNSENNINSIHNNISESTQIGIQELHEIMHTKEYPKVSS